MGLLDYIIIGILAVGLFVGLKKGLWSMLCKMIGVAVGLAAAYFFAKQLAVALSGTAVGNAVNKLVETITGFFGDFGGAVAVSDPGGGGDLMIDTGDKLLTVNAFLQSLWIPGFAHEYIEGLLTPNVTIMSVITPVVGRYLLIALSAIIIYLGARIVFAIVRSIVNSVIGTSGFGAINRLLGGVLNLAGAAVFVMFLLFFAGYLDFIPTVGEYVTKLINESVIAGWVGKINFVQIIIDKVIELMPALTI